MVFMPNLNKVNNDNNNNNNNNNDNNNNNKGWQYRCYISFALSLISFSLLTLNR